jgi:hypothetical protein
MLYEDDGGTRDYAGGAFALTRFTMTEADGALTLDISAPDGHAALIPANRRYTLRIRAQAAPRAVEGGEWQHGADGFLTVRLASGGRRTRIVW